MRAPPPDPTKLSHPAKLAGSDDKSLPDEDVLLPFTVRRPVAKLGRNDPCHCGSGKKYKKCCIEKDRVRLADPSPYRGLTMEEAKRDPMLHGDLGVFFEMSREELDAVDRAPLSTELLIGLAEVYVEQNAFAPAAAVLDVLAARGGEAVKPVAEARARLVYNALTQGDAAFAKEALRAHPPSADDYEGILNTLSADLASPELPALLERIEGLAREMIDDPFQLIDLADAIALGGLPGLSIMVGRAAAALRGQKADREVLDELLRTARAELGLPEEDPASWLLAQPGRAVPKRGAEAKLLEVEERLRERESAIQKMVSERDRLAGELSKRALTDEAGAPQPLSTASGAREEIEETRRLRRKVEELQAELRKRQEERQDLQRQLRASTEGEGGPASSVTSATSEYPRARGRSEPPPLAQEEPGETVPDESQAQLQAVRFSDLFYETARDVDDRRVVLRAQEVAARFGALDATTWKQAKKMQDLQNVFTLRVGIHHRVFVVRRDGEVVVRELVTREAFDRALKRYRKHEL